MSFSRGTKSLSIALLGTRGIPARYGGFETFAEEISTRLAARGHRVAVFNRRKFFENARSDRDYRGVFSESAPTIFHKYLETPLHGLTSFLKVSGADVVLLCNAANSPFSWILNLRGIPFVVNVDGIERKRAKWNSLGRLWYRLGEWSSVRFAGRVIADAVVIRDYYRSRYGCEAEVIPYGASPVYREPGETLRNFGLLPRRYLLYVSRLEPENNALGVVEAFSRIESPFPLVVVGDAPYAADYIARVKAAANDSVIFTGYQFGSSYQELQSNCYLYIQATEVGGTHPALVEAMAYGNCVVSNGTPENREVLGDAGFFYDTNKFEHLEIILSELLNAPEKVRESGNAARVRAEALYDWDRVTDAYEELLMTVAAPS